MQEIPNFKSQMGAHDLAFYEVDPARGGLRTKNVQKRKSVVFLKLPPRASQSFLLAHAADASEKSDTDFKAAESDTRSPNQFPENTPRGHTKSKQGEQDFCRMSRLRSRFQGH